TEGFVVWVFSGGISLRGPNQARRSQEGSVALTSGFGKARILKRGYPIPRDPFKHHRFPRDVILTGVRWYCRYALSYRDVRDMLEERGIRVDAATVYRWVRKFGPAIAKRTLKHRSWRGMSWHVDETYVRVNGRRCYLWRAIDQQGQMIDFRLTARRDAKAARAFFRQARNNTRLYQPITIITDKARNYSKVIGEMNRWTMPP
ncbi:MAG: IS6 family transposase, partial [Nitratireductor sp.]